MKTTVRSILVGLSLALTLPHASASIDADLESARETLGDFEKREELSKRLVELREKLETAKQDEVRLSGERDEVVAGIAEAKSAKARAEALARREKALGEELDELETPGRTYEKVTIKEISDVGLLIHHASGLARVSFEDLSDELRERFGYDAEMAAKQLAEEQENLARLHQMNANAGGGAGESKDDGAGTASTGRSSGSSTESKKDEPVKPRGRVTCVVKTMGRDKSVEVSALANCPATLVVRPTPSPPHYRTFSIAANQRFTQVVQVTGPYKAVLTARTGETLDSEGSLDKTGLGTDDIKLR